MKMSSSKIMTRNCAPIASIESLDDLSDLGITNNSNNNNNNNNDNLKLTSSKPKYSKQTSKLPTTPTTSNKKDCTRISTSIEADFEYKNYYKFGRILGKGSFGTVVECVRKHDDKPIALKFFKHKAIHKWIPESVITDDDIDLNLLKYSDYFSERKKFNQEQDENNQQRLLPSEVACLLRAHKIDGIVKILDFIPASEEVILDDQANNSSSDSSETELNKIDDDSIIGIVLERDPTEICLFDYLISNTYLEEDEARVIMKQLVRISLDLLLNGILHGDLKSENILINPKTKKIKVIDFGSAQLIDFNTTNSSSNGRVPKTNGFRKCNSQSLMTKPVRTFRGTNLYKPPEFILHHCFYPRPSTVWTFGVILFDMVCGHFPFDKDQDVLIHQDKEIEFSRPDLSENFKDLIKKCLAFYVADRIVIEKILNHPWMST